MVQHCLAFGAHLIRFQRLQPIQKAIQILLKGIRFHLHGLGLPGRIDQMICHTCYVQRVAVHGHGLSRLGDGVVDSGLYRHDIDKAQNGGDRQYKQQKAADSLHHDVSPFIPPHGFNTPCNPLRSPAKIPAALRH